ncbi:MAG: S8 family serine peptidase [Gemmatimonadaceae bacterium]
MEIQREWLEELIFRGEMSRRFTQDSPILPDVWLAFANRPKTDGRIDLLFTPHRNHSTADLYRAIRARLELYSPDAAPLHNLAYHQSSVVAELTFRELLLGVAPLSAWWRDTMLKKISRTVNGVSEQATVFDVLVSEHGATLIEREMQLTAVEVHPVEKPKVSRPSRTASPSDFPIPAEVLWLVRLIGTMLLADAAKFNKRRDPKTQFIEISRQYKEVTAAVLKFFGDLDIQHLDLEYPLYSVSRNRVAGGTISRSVMAVKGDAARRLFNIDCSDIGWAIIDSGIDAKHPAFRKRDPKTGLPYAVPFEGVGASVKNYSRVVRTFDLTEIRRTLNLQSSTAERMQSSPASTTDASNGSQDDLARAARKLTERIREGRPIDWDELLPLIEMSHDETEYVVPTHEHGTHVAGVMGSNWCRKDWPDSYPEDESADAIGVCPDVLLYDFRVLGNDGTGDEFTVMAALQLLRHLNASRERAMVHGINMSIALKHDVANYACGRTPVCDECAKTVSSGVVVVAAAGNEGYARFNTPSGFSDGYRSISIADPGNSDAVITVGATHRFSPHTYGVSYFSSRGPTGDGRIKPDLVAPGEKITAPVPDNSIATKDGTSMAAPHVSGVAALLMARHRELIGNPARIKEVLCKTATDLGRERYFQGAGMVDALRALQSV